MRRGTIATIVQEQNGAYIEEADRREGDGAMVSSEVTRYVSLAGIGGPGWTDSCGAYRPATMPRPEYMPGYDGVCVGPCTPTTPRGLVKTPFEITVSALTTERIVFATSQEAYLTAMALTGIFTTGTPEVSVPVAVTGFTVSNWEAGGQIQQYLGWGQSSTLTSQNPTAVEVPMGEYLAENLLNGESALPKYVSATNISNSNKGAKVDFTNNNPVDYILRFWLYLNYGGGK